MRDFAESHREDRLLHPAGRAGLALLFAALLAFLGPFGTYRFDAIERVGYWTVQMFAWLVLSRAAAWLVRHVPGLRSRSETERLLVATAAAAMPMMVVAGVANNMMNGWQPDPGELAELFVSIALIGGGYTVLADRMIAGLTRPGVGGAADAPASADGGDLAANDAGRGQASSSAGPSGPGPSDTGLIDRLPAHVRADILCLQVEDHYVRVHSATGSAMVLMRFSDALRGVDHLAGSQVHRSWWVALDAVTGLQRTGRTARLTLRNGTVVPVSQPYLAHATNVWGTARAAAG